MLSNVLLPGRLARLDVTTRVAQQLGTAEGIAGLPGGRWSRDPLPLPSTVTQTSNKHPLRCLSTIVGITLTSILGKPF